LKQKVVTIVERIERENEEGQTMAEYVVVLGMITITIVTTISLLSGAFNEAFERAIAVVEAAMGAG
jgi:Flp pilus assembly pilin Flp